MESNFITAIFLPLALGVIMFGMGMSLRPADFYRVVALPKAALLGLVNQLLLLPAIAFAIASVFRLGPELAMGIMILAVCPGGPTSNLISYLCKADVALSITLTALSSLVTVLTIPFLINFSLAHFVGVDGPAQLPLLDSIGKILVITLVPTALGMLLNHGKPDWCQKMTGTVNLASLVLFVLVLAGAIFSQKDELPGFFRQAGWAALALNVSTMVVGYLSAKLLRLPRAQGLTISIESGLQNGTLAIAIATSPLMLNSPPMAIVPAIYSLIMFVSSGFLIGLVVRSRRGQGGASASVQTPG
jgi:BASS family bile acid:Na+ symporter